MSLRNVSRRLFIISILTATASLIGLAQPERFFRSYLFAFLYWVDLPLGALGLLMIYWLTAGAWGAVVRKILEALADTLWLFAILLLPVLFAMTKIYPWLDPAIAADHKIAHKHIYLNATSFIVRAVLYFAVWIFFNRSIQRSAQDLERTSDTNVLARLKTLSAVGLLLFGFLISFASFDWQMSVEPKWSSTIYGMVYGVGQALQSYAAVLVIFGIASAVTMKAGSFTKKVMWDLGNILLTLIILWAYVSFMQYLIIWSGNLPHEVVWFEHRTRGGWKFLILAIAIFQFATPFSALLLRRSKETERRLIIVGAAVMLIRVADHYWMLMPAFFTEGFALPLQAVMLWISIGSLWIAVFLRRYAKGALFAHADPDWTLASTVQKEGATS